MFRKTFTNPIFYLGGVCLLFVVHAYHLNVIAEDAYITFRFGQNLAAGNGIVWNPGEGPVEGYTTLLWMLAAAALVKLGHDPRLVIQIAGVVIGIAGVVLAYLFALRVLKMGRFASLVPSVLLAASGPFAAWSSSGMEMGAFAVFALAAFYALARWAETGRLTHLVIAQAVFVVATLARPEGIALFALALLLALSWVMLTGRNPKRLLLSVLAYILPVLLYFVLRYEYFGFLLPNTFYAKTGATLSQVVRGFKYLLAFVVHFCLPLTPVLILALWELGLPRRLKGLGLRSRPIGQQGSVREFGIVVCLAVVFCYSLYVVVVGGDYMAMYRFFVPVLPFMYLAWGAVAVRLIEAGASTVRKAVVAGMLIGAAVAGTSLQSTPAEAAVFAKPSFMHGTYRGIQHERWAVRRFAAIADFFKKYSNEETDSLAVKPIGVIGFETGMRIHSLYAIVDPLMAHRPPKQEIGKGLAGHEKEDWRWVLAKKPTFVMLSADFDDQPPGRLRYPGEVSQLVKERYLVKSVWLRDDANDEAGYFTFLELKEAFRNNSKMSHRASDGRTASNAGTRTLKEIE